MNSGQAFENLVLPHLDAAFNLARWLLRDDAAAEDAVQDAAIRALRHIGSLAGDNARPWLLGIVRNTCFTRLERQRKGVELIEFDDAAFEAACGAAEGEGNDPATLLQQQRTRTLIDAAIQALAPALREVIVLREFEDLAYAEIAHIVAVPIGTVMSRLSRARDRLREALAHLPLDR